MRRNLVTANENKNEFGLRTRKECGRVPRVRREVMGHEMGEWARSHKALQAVARRRVLFYLQWENIENFYAKGWHDKSFIKMEIYLGRVTSCCQLEIEMIIL